MLGNALLLALRELRRNVMRSFLTMLGIIIGVASVIILVTLGGGATRQVTEQIASLGSNLLMINPGKHMGPGQSSGAAPFKLADAEALARDIPSLVAVAPAASSSMMAILANENWTTAVTGSTEQYFTLNNRKIKEGRVFISNETRVGVAVCVIGETVRAKLFGRQNPVGSHIRLNKLSCEVIGLLEAKGQSTMGTDQDDLVVIPLRTFQRRIAGNEDVSIIQVSVRDGVSTDRVKQEIVRLMRVRRHIANSEENNFDVMDMKEIATMLSGTTQVLTALLGAVAGVSLLVGGIGIMNVMLAIVMERVPEIGIRRAVGASQFDILWQFLAEAVVLSTAGGILGCLLGVLAVPLASYLTGFKGVITSSSVLISITVSWLVGVIFGFTPASRAANLDPVECLRSI